MGMDLWSHFAQVQNAKPSSWFLKILSFSWFNLVSMDFLGYNLDKVGIFLVGLCKAVPFSLLYLLLLLLLPPFFFPWKKINDLNNALIELCFNLFMKQGDQHCLPSEAQKFKGLHIIQLLVTRQSDLFTLTHCLYWQNDLTRQRHN